MMYECKTIYQGTAASGYQLVFSASKASVSIMSKGGGTFWVRPRGPAYTSGTVPTSPIPAAGVVADGWVRLVDGDSATFGVDSLLGVRRVTGGGVATKFLDVWCEVSGDLIVVAV